MLFADGVSAFPDRVSIKCHPLPPLGATAVCNVRTLYSAGLNFRQCIFAIWYLGHPLTSTENFTQIVPEEPLRWGEGFKRKRGSQI